MHSVTVASATCGGIADSVKPANKHLTEGLKAMNFDNWKHIYIYVRMYQERLEWIDEEDIRQSHIDYQQFLLWQVLNNRHYLMCAFNAMLENHGIEAPEHETFRLGEVI